MPRRSAALPQRPLPLMIVIYSPSKNRYVFLRKRLSTRRLPRWVAEIVQMRTYARQPKKTSMTVFLKGNIG